MGFKERSSILWGELNPEENDSLGVGCTKIKGLYYLITESNTDCYLKWCDYENIWDFSVMVFLVVVCLFGWLVLEIPWRKWKKKTGRERSGRD